MKMLIMRGIKNLLHEEPAKQYAIIKGYDPVVLDASGETGYYSAQTNLAIKAIEEDPEITALYGFSGGGYNAQHIWSRLDQKYKDQITKIVVIGAPGVLYGTFKGCEDVTIYNNRDVAHMEQPEDFLKNMA